MDSGTISLESKPEVFLSGKWVEWQHSLPWLIWELKDVYRLPWLIWELKDVHRFPGGAGGKEPACQCTWHKRGVFNPWIRKIPLEEGMATTPVVLPGESHGQRSLRGYSPYGCKRAGCDWSGWVHTVSGIVLKNLPTNAGDTGSIPGSGRSPGGGNGNPLQYPCLGNPMDRRVWWDTVLGVAKSGTRLSARSKYYMS